MKKPPPKLPGKPAKKRVAVKKAAKPVVKPKAKPKVVPINAPRKSAPKKGGARKPKRPSLLIYAEYRKSDPIGPKLYTKHSVFDDPLPDPELVLEERKKYTKDTPTVHMRRAIVRAIRKGAPVREALLMYGVTEGEFLRWRGIAQQEFEDGKTSSPFLDFIRVLEIAEAQGESMTAMDARVLPENTMPFLRSRYARNWDGKMSGAPPLAFLKEPEVEVPLGDEDAAYMLALLESARGGRKPIEEPEPAAQPEKI